MSTKKDKVTNVTTTERDELRAKVENTQTFNKNVYFSTLSEPHDNGVLNWDEAVDEILNLFDQYLAKEVLQHRINLLDMAYDTIISYGYMRDDGKYFNGGFSTQELAFSYMREEGLIDKKGLFDPKKFMKHYADLTSKLDES